MPGEKLLLKLHCGVVIYKGISVLVAEKARGGFLAASAEL
jgi:hypothetical protein